MGYVSDDQWHRSYDDLPATPPSSPTASCDTSYWSVATKFSIVLNLINWQRRTMTR